MKLLISIQNILYTFFMMSFFSCATYVPVEYRTIGEYSAAKNSKIKVTDAKNPGLAALVKKAIIDDGWWSYDDSSKANYEIVLDETTNKTYEESSSISNSGEKPVRSASFRSDGSINFTITQKNKNFSKSFSVSSIGRANSSVEMPKEHGANSLWPLVHSLVGYNPLQDAIGHQNSWLAIDAQLNLDSKLALEVIKKVTPEKKFVKVELEISQADLKPFEKHINAAEFDMAYNYLLQLQNKDIRSEVQYNLGVIQEIRQKYTDACSYYQKAYNLKDKKLYLEQLNACEVRKIENAKLSQI